MNKKQMSEQDIRSKFITPAIVVSGWDLLTQIREEVTFTQGKVIVRGKLVSRGKAKRADYILDFFRTKGKGKKWHVRMEGEAIHLQPSIAFLSLSDMLVNMVNHSSQQRAKKYLPAMEKQGTA